MTDPDTLDGITGAKPAARPALTAGRPRFGNSRLAGIAAA